MHQGSLVACLLASLAVSSCAESSPTEKLQKDRDRLTSWQATGELVETLDHDDALPDAYASDMRRLISEELNRAREKLAADSATAP
jgi:hypothetical protein